MRASAICSQVRARVNVFLLGLTVAEEGYRSRYWGTYRQIAQTRLPDWLSPVSLDGGWSKAAMVELRGLEPLTPCLPSKCSTN